eukprot:366058-Chlamydomonas_euryale.AAC.3
METAPERYGACECHARDCTRVRLSEPHAFDRAHRTRLRARGPCHYGSNCTGRRSIAYFTAGPSA